MSSPSRSHTDTPVCGKFVSWWDGEYEGECELPEGHDGDHNDGLSWYDDDGRNTDDEHRHPYTTGDYQDGKPLPGFSDV